MNERKRYATLWERLVANTVELEETGCWIWTGPQRNGRGCLSMRVEGVPHPVNFNASRLVLEVTTGWLFPFDEVGHYKCFEPLCICPDHIRIETQAENLSTRRGYAETSNEERWIPVLFPTPERELQEAADRAWDRIGSVLVAPGEPCPF